MRCGNLEAHDDDSNSEQSSIALGFAHNSSWSEFYSRIIFHCQPIEIPLNIPVESANYVKIPLKFQKGTNYVKIPLNSKKVTTTTYSINIPLNKYLLIDATPKKAMLGCPRIS